MIIDSHCHLYDNKLNEIKQEILKSLTKTPQIAICNGDNIETSIQSINLANNNANIFATIGIHPHEAKTFDESSIKKLENLAKNKKVVAIGEIGLDYFYNFSPKETQKNVLIQQIVLASKLKLPCVFHIREATQDFLDIVKDLTQKYNFSGYVHSFSGSIETVKIYLSYGFYIGINGIITFKNANKMLDVVKFLPLNRILIETDAPYLTPVPYRGKLNRPEYVELVANKIAELKGLSLQDVISATTQNAKTFFNLPE